MSATISEQCVNCNENRALKELEEYLLCNHQDFKVSLDDVLKNLNK